MTGTYPIATPTEAAGLPPAGLPVEWGEWEFERDPRGEAYAWRGRQAIVYRVRTREGRIGALRIKPSDGADRHARYCEAREYLRRRPVAGLIDFQSLSDVAGGEPSDGRSVLLMDWAAGVGLGAYVDEQVRASAGGSLALLAERWRDLVGRLEAAGVVHGDLEPGNILVGSDGTPVLIDYDGLAVPSRMGLPVLETGTPPFQHPERTAETPLFPGLDRFSALAIYTALRALAADPTLRLRYSVARPQAPLVLAAEDFATDDARLFRDWFRSPDEQVRDLAHYLREVRRGRLADVPSLEEVLLWCESLGDLLARHDFDRAVALAARLGPEERIEPATLPAIDDACRRVEQRRRLERALQTRAIDEITQAYVPELLDDYPAAAGSVERARRALEADRAVDQMQAAVEEGRWSDFAGLWHTHASLVAEHPEAPVYRRRYEGLTAVERLEALLNDPSADDDLVEARWRAVHAEGDPPDAERLRQAWNRRELRRRRLAKINELITASETAPTFADDRELRALWREAARAGEKGLEPLRARYQLADRRMHRLRSLNELTRNPTLAGERRIAASGQFLPPTYHPRLPGRIQLAQQRLEAVRVLTEALVEPISDRGLAAAADGLIAARGEMFIDASQQVRIETARRRAVRIEALFGCRTLADDERERRILELWDDSIPDDCRDAAELVPLRNEARRRREALARLDEALAGSEPAIVQRLSADPLLAGRALPPEIAERLAAFRGRLHRERLRRRHELVQAILEHDVQRFCAAFDCELAAEVCGGMPQQQRVVGAWIEREILPHAEVKPADAPTSAKASDGSPAAGADRPVSRRLTWTWPPAAVVRRCDVTLSREAPPARATPDDLELVARRRFERDPLAPDVTAVDFDAPPSDFDDRSRAEGLFAVVWPVVDVGFQVFYGRPLALGRFRPPDQ